MIRLPHLAALALLALAVGQIGGQARAATTGGSFGVTVRVETACEASGLCGSAAVRELNAAGQTESSSTTGATLTPLAPTADGVNEPGERIRTQDKAPVEIDF